jgi:hypothetical protein
MPEHLHHMPAVWFGDAAPQFEDLVVGGLLIGGRSAGVDRDVSSGGLEFIAPINTLIRSDRGQTHRVTRHEAKSIATEPENSES